MCTLAHLQELECHHVQELLRRGVILVTIATQVNEVT